MRGFFHESEITSKDIRVGTVPQCGACGLSKHCISPKMRVHGRGKRGILIVGESPGETEDERGRPFVGKSGTFLRDTLRSLGISMDRDCWITNAIICRPRKNARPTDKQIAYCRPNVWKFIQEQKPTCIILFGGVAVSSVITPAWNEAAGKFQRWVGWQIPSRKLNTWICPTWHPAHLLREDNQALYLLFEKHLKKAIAKAASGKPYDVPPDDRSKVRVITDSSEAAKAIAKFTKEGGTGAFDFETNKLKPDSEDRKIVCASICWKGRDTIAYPWQGDAIEASKQFLASPRVRKIMSNMKFEDRWARAALGLDSIASLFWDTMLAAHVMNNVPGVTSIKFLSFALLGAPIYNQHVEPFLRPTDADDSKRGNNAPNQIHKVEMRDLLLYCGLDSLYEYKVAMIQRRLLLK